MLPEDRKRLNEICGMLSNDDVLPLYYNKRSKTVGLKRIDETDIELDIEYGCEMFGFEFIETIIEKTRCYVR